MHDRAARSSRVERELILSRIRRVDRGLRVEDVDRRRKPMTTETNKKMIWTGRVLSGLAALLLLLDGVMKLVQPKEVIEATTKLGYSESHIAPIGLILLA